MLRFFRRHLLATVGFVPVVYKIVRFVLDMAGYTDLVASHAEAQEATWVTRVMQILLSPPNWLQFLAIIAGLAAIWWDVRRVRRAEPQPSAVKQAAPVTIFQTPVTATSVADNNILHTVSAIIDVITDDSDEGKEFTNKGVMYFKPILETNRLQADVLLAPYIGMRINYSGFLDGNNINEAPYFIGLGVNVSGGRFGGGVFLICRYPKKHRNYIMRLDAGEAVFGVGTIAEISIGNLVLNGCRPTSPRDLHHPTPKQLPPPA